MAKEKRMRNVLGGGKENPQSGVLHDMQETNKQIDRKKMLLEKFPNDNFLKVSLSELLKTKKQLETVLNTSI